MSAELAIPDRRRGWRPRFLREIAAYAETAQLERGAHETLLRDNITVAVEGDMDALRAHRGGMLFVGNHQYQWEFVGAMAMAHLLERQDMRHIAKFYVQRQVYQALGRSAAARILPVFPRILARDRGEWRNSETINRFLYHRSLLTRTESAKVNDRTLRVATDHLTEGGAVNIFPCGSVVDWRTHPWRIGAGHIINNLDTEAGADTLVVPYRMDQVERIRLLAAVALRGRGFARRPQRLTMHVGAPLPAAELAGGDAMAVTVRLRDYCLGQLHPETHPVTVAS